VKCKLCDGLVTWRGPLTALTHTKCESCGGQNCQDDSSDDDEPVPEEPVHVPRRVAGGVKYEVRQQVRSAHKRWMVVLYESEFERPARCSYESLVADDPDGYFELVEVLHTENCLRFTPKLGPTNTAPRHEPPNVELRGAPLWARPART